MCSRPHSTDLAVQIQDRFGVYFDIPSHMEASHERLKLALLEELGFRDVSLRIRPRFGVATHPGTTVSGVVWSVSGAGDWGLK